MVVFADVCVYGNRWMKFKDQGPTRYNDDILSVYFLTVLSLHPYTWKNNNIAFILKNARHGNVCHKYMFIDVWIWLVLWSKPQPSIPCIPCVIIKVSNNLNRSLKFCDRPSLFPELWIRLTSHYHSAGRHESVFLFSKGWLHEEAALGRN